MEEESIRYQRPYRYLSYFDDITFKISRLSTELGLIQGVELRKHKNCDSFLLLLLKVRINEMVLRYPHFERHV